jgi:DNA primase
MNINNLEEIKEKADIVEVVGRVLTLKKQGKDYWSPCPFHGDSSPSFSVSGTKQFYKCFGCGAKGDVIDFWQKFNNLSFPQAAAAVAQMYGINFLGQPVRDKNKYPELPRDKAAWTPENITEPNDLWKEKAGKFMIWAYEQIFEHPEVLEYLAKRGINTGTIGAYGLGWNSGEKGRGLYRAREAWGLPKELDDKGRTKVLWLPIGLVLPGLNAKSEVIKLRIRRPDPLTFAPDIRYYVVPGGAKVNTVLNPNRKAHVVVESDLDAYLVAQEAGDLVGVVCPGSCSVRPDAAAAKVLRDSLHILNAMDFDKAGALSWPWWKQNFKNCERWPVPVKKDPGEAWQNKVNIRNWVLAGLPAGLR